RGVDEVARLVGELRVQAHDVRARDQIRLALAALDAQLRRELLGPIVAEAEDRHAEGARALRDLLADAAEADDADGLARELVSGDALPAAGARVVDLLDEVADE